MSRLTDVATRNDPPHGLREEAQIQGERTVVDVPHVELELLLPCHRTQPLLAARQDESHQAPHWRVDDAWREGVPWIPHDPNAVRPAGSQQRALQPQREQRSEPED